MQIENSSISSEKVVKATKWSVITEATSKLVTPITNMVLARLLTPDAFGVITTITMIITFAEIFTDAGFQKYLIQHQFIDEHDKEKSTTVAFWCNLSMSLIIWGWIAFFCEKIAIVVGNPGLGYVITVSCVAIPLAAFSSIQMALYKRNLDFKTLFKVRIVGICIPLFVTIPCALVFRNFWALLIGILTKDIVNAILLTLYSKWKPRFYFSYNKLKEMFSFTVWSMIEAISIWLTSYIDVFLVGALLSQHYLGLYKTSMTLVGQIMGLITASTTPILFSSLSRLQDDDNSFSELFFKFQKYVGMLVIPIGVCIYCYSDFITTLLLGSQWKDASKLIGLWGLTSAVMIVLAHYSSEVYRAKGRPKLSVLAQWLHIIVLWPTVVIAIDYGFETLCTARALIRLEGILVNLMIMYYVVKISYKMMIRNILPICLSSSVILFLTVLFSYLFPEIWFFKLVEIVICLIAYTSVLYLFPTNRYILMQLKNRFSQKLVTLYRHN